MTSRTVTAVLAAPKEQVFDYLSSIENLPDWATEFALGLVPTRVVSLPGDTSAFSFTMFQAPGMPDELFESQYQSLLREFENIRREFAS